MPKGACMASTYQQESAKMRRHYQESVRMTKLLDRTPRPIYYWLNTTDGQWVIGTRGNWHRVSWAVMYSDGTHGCVNDDDVVAKLPVSFGRLDVVSQRPNCNPE